MLDSARYWWIYFIFCIIITASPSQQGAAGHVEVRGDVRRGGRGPGILRQAHSPDRGQMSSSLYRLNITTLQLKVFIVILTFFLVSPFFHLLSDGISQDVSLGSVATHFCFLIVLKHVMVFFFLVHFSVITLFRIEYTFGMFAHFSVSSWGMSIVFNSHYFDVTWQLEVTVLTAKAF